MPAQRIRGVYQHVLTLGRSLVTAGKSQGCCMGASCRKEEHLYAESSLYPPLPLD